MKIESAFQGRITKAPTLRTAQTGKPWCTFTVAVGNEEHADHVQWVSVVAFNDLAVQIAGTERGTAVYVEGVLSLETWEKDGQPRSGLKVKASLIQPMGQIGRRKLAKAKPEGASADKAPSPRSADAVYRPLEGAQTGRREPGEWRGYADSEIPF